MYIWFYRLAADQWLAWAGNHARDPQDAPLPSGSNPAGVLPKLSARERLVFALKSNQRLALPTVAQIVDLPEETVARIFTRAVAKLRLSTASSRTKSSAWVGSMGLSRYSLSYNSTVSLVSSVRR